MTTKRKNKSHPNGPTPKRQRSTKEAPRDSTDTEMEDETQPLDVWLKARGIAVRRTGAVKKLLEKAPTTHDLQLLPAATLKPMLEGLRPGMAGQVVLAWRGRSTLRNQCDALDLDLVDEIEKIHPDGLGQLSDAQWTEIEGLAQDTQVRQQIRDLRSKLNPRQGVSTAATASTDVSPRATQEPIAENSSSTASTLSAVNTNFVAATTTWSDEHVSHLKSELKKRIEQDTQSVAIKLNSIPETVSPTQRRAPGLQKLEALISGKSRPEVLRIIQQHKNNEIPEAILSLLSAFERDPTAQSKQDISTLVALLQPQDAPAKQGTRSVFNIAPMLSVIDIVQDGWGLADVAKDRNSNASFSAEEMLLNKIMQRQGEDIFGLSTQSRADLEQNPWKRKSTAAPSTDTPKSTAHILTDLMQQLSFPARAVVHRQLLEQRLPVPLFTRHTVTNEFLCHAQALRYAPVLIDIDTHANLLSDTNLPRVALLCDRPARKQQTGELAEKIFGLRLFAASAKLENVWLAELGLGTCHNQAVVVLSVFGDVQPVLEFADAWADIVLVETDDTAEAPHKTLRTFATRQNFPSDRVWPWTVSSSEFQVGEVFVGSDPTILGMSQLVFDHILTEEFLKRSKVDKLKTLEECLASSPNIRCDIVNMSEVENQLRKQLPFGGHQLVQLQKSFAREHQLRHKADNVPADQPFQRSRAQAEAENEKLWRFRNVHQLLMQPAIQAVFFIIAIGDSSTRTTALLELEECMRRFEISIDKTTQLKPEHIWREITLIFASDPTHFDFVAEHAARVMLDGFALELVDGEARAIVEPWIDALVSKLDKQMCQRIDKRPARVVALSTFGEQSCGKSTLLNVGFGCRLRASVGRCTRGINFQIIARSGYQQDENGADFIVLLDTEGIRAPEFQGVVEHDNFLAMLAVIPTDACVMLIRGESVQAMEQTIPLVVHGMESSKEVTEATARGNATQLFAAFIAVDRNQKKSCDTLAAQMVHRMRNNIADAIALVQGRKFSDANIADLTASVLSSFNQDAITFVGSYKVDRPPPKDEPVTDYGLRVHEMLQGTLEKVLEDRRTPTTLQDWSRKLEIAIRCAKSARWRSQLSDIKQVRIAEELDQLMLQAGNEVAKTYSEQFNILTQEMRRSDQQPNRQFMEQRLKTCAHKIESTQREHLQAEFENRLISESQKSDRLLKFDLMTSNLQHHWFAEIVQTHECFVSFETIANKYKQELQVQIQELHKAGTFRDLRTQYQQLAKFKELFNNIMHQADETSPLISGSVQDNVRGRYSYLTHLKAADFENSVPPDSASWQSWLRSLTRYLPFSRHQPEHIPTILNTVRTKLANVQRYEESIINDVVRIVTTYQTTHQIKSDEQRQMHVAVCRFLEGQLHAKQLEWEKTNSVQGRLNSSRADMQDFFLNTLEGLNLSDLLAKSLSDGINTRLKRSATEFLSSELANDLASGRAKWVNSPTIVRAEVDLALVEAAEQGFEHVWPMIQDPSKHYSNTIEMLIKQHMCNPGSEPAVLLEKFVTQIKNELRENVERKSNIHDLLHYLRGSKHACLFETAAGLSAGVFGGLSPENTVSGLNKAIKSIDFNVTDNWDQVIPPPVLRLLRSGLFPSGTTRISCFAVCPLCGLTCEKRVGHDDVEEGGSDDDKLHDCRHQVAGLHGFRVKSTNELDWQSCSTSAQRDEHFSWRGGEWVRYREFNSKFPTWKSPSWDALDESDEKFARNFMFCKFNKEIAQKWNVEPTPNEHLTKYNQTSDVVKEKLKARAQRQ